MRILFISNLYPPHDLGGMEQLCQEAVEHLRARKQSCYVLTSRHDLNRSTQPEAGVERTLHLQADIHYYRPLDFFRRRPRQERANQAALRRAIDQFQPDVIFIWGMWNLSQQIAYWAEQWMPGRVAYAVAGYWFMQPDPHESYWRQPARRGVTRVLMAPARRLALHTLRRERQAYPLRLEQVACVSAYVRDKLDQAGVLPHGARVIYNGIDPQPYLHAAARRPAGDGSLRLVYTGGLLAHKGVHTAIEALGLLKAQDALDSIRLDIVGSGHPDYEAQLRARVQALDLGDHVAFRGRVPRSAIPSVLAGHDVFLFTSVYEEPIARSVMEAMAAGLAVIGTPVGGQAEMLNHAVNALVYPPDDAEKLAACISMLRNDPALCSQLASAGQNMVLERFTLRRMVDEVELWLEEIVE